MWYRPFLHYLIINTDVTEFFLIEANQYKSKCNLDDVFQSLQDTPHC